MYDLKKESRHGKSGKYNFLDEISIYKEYVSYSQYSNQGYRSSSLLPYLTDDGKSITICQ